MQARCVVSGKDWHAWVEVTRSRGAEIERCAKTRLGAILRVCPDGRNLKPRRLQGGRTDGAGAAPAPDRGHRPGGAWRCTGGILQPVPFCPSSNQLIIHAITIRAVFKARILVSDFYTLHLCMFCPSSTAPVSEWTSLRCAKNPCNQKQLA